MIYYANPYEQFKSKQDDLEEAVIRVMRSGQYVIGPEVNLLEKEFAEFIGVSSAIGVANGTDAIEIALRALGVGVGDEVITVSHTAVATIAAIESVGAIPVLADVSPDTYTLDYLQLPKLISTKTKAVIVVHLYGQPAHLNEIVFFCKRFNLKLIEDVSQAHGATLNGKRLGSFGEVACFSCYPTKNLGAIGDAGIITTNNTDLALKIRMIREYGWKNRYISELAGRNSRLDEIQAAILRVKLRSLDSDNQLRKSIASIYLKELKSLPIVLPGSIINSEPVFHLFVIRIKHREELMKHLLYENIQTGIHYPVPVHLQPAYNTRIRTSTSMSVTEMLANEVLSLPIYPELSLSSVRHVVAAISKYFNENQNS